MHSRIRNREVPKLSLQIYDNEFHGAERAGEQAG
jgi:hypothetical protein